MKSLTPDILLAFIHIDRLSKIPMYVQVYEQIKDGIFKGLLKNGDRMPSTRSFSEALGVSRNCVLLAFEQLNLEGFLTGSVGSGTFVQELIHELKNDVPPTQITELVSEEPVLEDFNLTKEVALYTSFVSDRHGKEAIVPFQPSVPSFTDFPFNVWARIVSSVYRNIQQLHLGYETAQILLMLREALTDYLRLNRSIHCSPEQIVIVNGSSQALNLISEMLLKKGELCWMEDPGYLWAKSTFSRFGAEICPIPITSEGMDLNYAQQNYPNAQLAYVTPSHQMPLGTTMPLTQRIKLLKLAADQKMWIIEEDYETEFRYKHRAIPALKGLDTFGRVIHIGSFNKSIFPALRIGYIVLPSDKMAREITVIKAMADRQDAIIDHAVLTKFIIEGHFLRHLRRMRLIYKKKQQQLIDLLNKHLGNDVRITATDAGMHIILWFLKIKNPEDISKLAKGNDIILYAVDDLAIRFKNPNAFILGFTGFNLLEMEHAVIKLKNIVDDLNR